MTLNSDGEGVRDSAITKAMISTSKAVPWPKGERIVKGHPESCDYSPRFKNWVKCRRFKLVSYAALGLRDVLCLPAKRKFTAWRRATLELRRH